VIDTGRTIYFNKSFYLKKSYFYKSFGVRPKSYIGQIISRIHDYYFKNSCLLKKDYKKYYKKEYSSFNDYLDKKHNLFQHEIKDLNYHAAFFSNKHIAERFKSSELLSYTYDDNVIREKMFDILKVENDAFGELNFYED
jgi:hypothetical protein